MRIPSSVPVPSPQDRPAAAASPHLVPIAQTPPQDAPPSTGAVESVSREVTARTGRFSVLNDFRYLTDSDKSMLSAVTGEQIEPGFTDRPGSASAFALQLALDRRTGQLAPNQQVTSVYLRNAAAELDRRHEQRPGFTNPYSGEFMERAVSWLDAHGRSRADIRM